MEPFRSSSCKSDMMIRKRSCSPKLENAVNKIAERKDDLANRQRYLRDKISTLEKSIPALMAFNMWTSGQNCEDAPFCKIKEIMNKFAPYSDPTEKLLGNLKKTIQDLEGEISELHEKIISADVDIEENGMELESLELSNKEMENELKTLEEEVDSGSSFSMHSIHSEDLICLNRIRQLGEEERNLKSCMRQLEEKEEVYRKQIESLLISKDFQNSLGGSRMAKRLKELEENDKKWRCTYQTQKYNMHQMKKKIIEKEQKLARLANQSGINQSGMNQSGMNQSGMNQSGMNQSGTNQSGTNQSGTNQMSLQEEEEEVPLFEEDQERESGGDDYPPLINKRDWTSWKENQNNSSSGKRPNCPPRSCCIPLSKLQTPEKKSCRCSSNSRHGCLKQISEPKSKICSDNPLCQPPPCDKSSVSCPPIKADPFGRKTSGRSYSPNQSCKKCPSSRKSNCSCFCKGKCSQGKSESPCNCGTEIENNYQPKAKNRDICNLEETSSDDEFCECNCGCNDEDGPGSCLSK